MAYKGNPCSGLINAYNRTVFSMVGNNDTSCFKT